MIMDEKALATILLIEDNPSVADPLREGLTEEGYEMVVAFDGYSAEQELNKRSFDAVLLDLGLPDRDGMDLLATIRGKYRDCPVIIITARDRLNDRVMGLDGGADDYLVKPFAYSELAARLRALLRRAESSGPIIKLASITADKRNRTVEREGQQIFLSPREFDILAYLIQHRGRTVSRSMLVQDIWQETNRATSLDNVIDVHLHRLREKLDKEFDQKLIKTVRGVGYCFDG